VLSLRLDGNQTIVAEVFAKAGVAEGPRTVSISGVAGTGQVAVYEAVDYIRITPERGFARPGGIRTPKIFQQYEVVGYANGPDNAKGTDDDVKLGRIGPVTWNLEEYVKRPNDDDIRYVGAVDQTGLFHPNEDGPNPKRHLMEGNVGDVWVEAWYTPEGAKRPMGARAHLLVMPAKFVFPPIE
jgi:quinohemoprotein amine dehydrogenase